MVHRKMSKNINLPFMKDLWTLLCCHKSLWEVKVKSQKLSLIEPDLMLFISGVFTSSLVLLALSILTPFFQYIPKATLAAVIITSVLRMVNIRIIKKIWQTRRIDVLPLLITFFVCLYEIAIGIMCGIGVAVVIVLYRNFVPRIETQGGEVCYVRVDGGLTYLGIEYFTSQVKQLVFFSDKKPDVVVIQCDAMLECDFTVTQGFSQIVQDCKDCDIKVVLFCVKDNVKLMLVNGGLPLDLFRDELAEEFCGSLKPNDNGLLNVNTAAPEIKQF